MLPENIYLSKPSVLQYVNIYGYGMLRINKSIYGKLWVWMPAWPKYTFSHPCHYLCCYTVGTKYYQNTWPNFQSILEPQNEKTDVSELHK